MEKKIIILMWSIVVGFFFFEEAFVFVFRKNEFRRRKTSKEYEVRYFMFFMICPVIGQKWKKRGQSVLTIKFFKLFC